MNPLATKNPTDKEHNAFYDFDIVAEEAAASVGCKVVLPKENQLQIDLDSEDAYGYFNRRLEDVYKRLPWDFDIDVKPSKSGLPHRHITLTFNDKTFTPMEQIVYQMMLGSDPIREGLNALRLASGVANPTRFFEPIGE